MAMLLLWTLSLAASFLLPATGEVVQSFSRCSQFFLNKKPPQLKPRNPARICQLHENKYRFATMYDRDRHIPLFSAYKYKPGDGERAEEWMIEPQLALPNNHRRKSMELQSNWLGNDYELLRRSQAVEQDFRGYDRGHLAPSLHQEDQESRRATFTLTNIVPQYDRLNQGQWRVYEERINKEGCNEVYIIVGAVPSTNSIDNRVNVPSYIWAAGCCELGKHRRRSWAVIANNERNEVHRCTLQQLQNLLAVLYRKKKIDLFNHACEVADTTQVPLSDCPNLPA